MAVNHNLPVMVQQTRNLQYFLAKLQILGNFLGAHKTSNCRTMHPQTIEEFILPKFKVPTILLKLYTQGGALSLSLSLSPSHTHTHCQLTNSCKLK